LPETTPLDTLQFKAQHDLCLSFWAVAYEKGWIHFPLSARVLEIGCAEADWITPMLDVRPDLDVTGLDWRACERPGKTVKGDAMWQGTFRPETFDAVVSISAIEHVGLGHYDNDPVLEEGDVRAMWNAHRWLKRGGWMYLDVPFADEGFTVYPSYRRYDMVAIERRLLAPGFRLKHKARCVTEHPDGPYMALLIEKI
jgi:hypothetical protein